MPTQATRIRPGERITPLHLRAEINRRGENPIVDPYADRGITVAELMRLLCISAGIWVLGGLACLALLA